MHVAEQAGYGQNGYSISSATFPMCWAEISDLMEKGHKGLPHSGHKIRKCYLQWWGDGGEKDVNGAVSLEDKYKLN